MDVNFERTAHVVGLGVKQTERVCKMLQERELTFDEWARETLVAELERWEKTHSAGKRPVGRPRISMEEKKFRDTVQQIEKNFLRLREVWGLEAAQANFGDIWQQYQAYVNAHDQRHITWLAVNWSGVPGTANDPEVRQKFLQEWEQCAERKLESFS